MALLHPCMKLCNSAESQSKAEWCWRGKKRGKILASAYIFAGSVHPGLGEFSAAFTLDPIHRVKAANTAWALQGAHQTGRNQMLPSVNPITLSASECSVVLSVCFAWIGK